MISRRNLFGLALVPLAPKVTTLSKVGTWPPSSIGHVLVIRDNPYAELGDRLRAIKLLEIETDIRA